MKTKINKLTPKQKHYLQEMSLWIWKKSLILGQQEIIKVLGDEWELGNYILRINKILVLDTYKDDDREWLNELRGRYLWKSLDIHYTMSI